MILLGSKSRSDDIHSRLLLEPRMNTSLHVLLVFVLVLIVLRLQKKSISFEVMLGALLLATVVVYIYKWLFPSNSLAVEYDEMINKKQDARVSFLRSVGFPV